MTRIAFLCSGNGGNLRYVWHAVESGVLPAEICGVFADRACGAEQFARARGIQVVVGAPDQLGCALAEFAPDLVVSTYHRMIPSEIVDRYRRRIINLHYSLLPAFGGKGMIGEAPVRAALEAGYPIGTTVHYVDEGLDTGEIIFQSRVPVRDGLPFEQQMNAVFHHGAITLLAALLRLCAERAA